MSKAITEKQDDRQVPGGWGPSAEAPPSVLREDEPSFARTVGMLGAALLIFGGMALAFNLSGRLVRVSSAWATFVMSVGLAGLLFHAAFDRDLQFRRVYLVFGFVALLVGAFLCVVPAPRPGGQFGSGVPCMFLGLLFLLATHRNETDPWVRNVTELAVALAGALMALVGLVGGLLQVKFLLPYGLVLALLGLLYLTAFVVTRGTGNDVGYRAALGVGLVGLVAFLAAVVVSFARGNYFLPQGALVIALGVLYFLFALFLCWDGATVVLTRRELGAFFYSPMAYLVLLGITVMSWVNFLFFMNAIMRRPAFEPIVGQYFRGGWVPIFVNIFLVPMLTMRLLSEEKRSGTLEVLLTAPVRDTSVALSKFFAALIMYVVLWIPFGLFLLSIPLLGGSAFDYRPLLSFFIGVVVTGAGFIGMGLFFSSLTNSQIASFVLGMVGMVGLTAISVGSYLAGPETAWGVFFRHLSYLEVWETTLDGRLVLRDLLFFLSLAVLGVFLTVKVLEARKWR